MNFIRRMIDTHPQGTKLPRDLAENILVALAECEQVCVACADACLAEQNVDVLRRCIRLNLDCADACGVTRRVLTRQTAPDRNVVRALLEACAIACRACAEECEKHAGHHEHCRMCADACRRCEQYCRDLVGNVGAIA